MELEPNILRDKTQRCIFRSPDFVSGVISLGMTILISFRFRDRDVEVYSSVAGFRIAFGIRVLCGRKIARCGLALLVLHFRALVKAIHDRDAFPHTSGAVNSLRRPSLPFGRVGNIAVHFLDFTPR